MLGPWLSLSGEDAPSPPQHLIVEQLKSSAWTGQLAALAEQDIELHRFTRIGDTVASVLRRLDLRDLSAAAVLMQHPALRAVFDGSAGRLVDLRSTGHGDFIDLVVRSPAEAIEQTRSRFLRLPVGRMDGVWSTHKEAAAYTIEPRRAAGVIRSTLKAAADEIQLPLPVTLQLADFAVTEEELPRPPRKGDVFSVVYEALFADGLPVTWSEGAGRVLAAEFSGAGLSQQMIWFQDQAGMAGYFDRKGRRMALGNFASAVESARISSGFEVRMGPILRRAMAHRGVDYSAPLGTPVHGVAPGVVEFAGQQSGYGNVVELRHGPERTTL